MSEGSRREIELGKAEVGSKDNIFKGNESEKKRKEDGIENDKDCPRKGENK